MAGPLKENFFCGFPKHGHSLYGLVGAKVLYDPFAHLLYLIKEWSRRVPLKQCFVYTGVTVTRNMRNTIVPAEREAARNIYLEIDGWIDGWMDGWIDG